MFEEYAGIEVSGESVRGTLHGFRNFSLLATQYLSKEGLGQKGKDGIISIEPDKWYPLDRWLRVFDQISKEVGPAVLQQIGMGVMENIQWPPGTDSFESIIRAIDAGYHMHHRKGGRQMFDPATGQMQEGIGHIALASHVRNSYVMDFSNPYPCAFDKGIIFGAARRLGRRINIQHGPGEPCRSEKRSPKCMYVVTTL